MGAALAEAALRLEHDVTIVSGPVGISYPEGANVVPVVTTDDMLEAAIDCFKNCDGAIGAAAPCDYMPRFINDQKIAKTGEPLALQLVETPDVVATLGQMKKRKQWVVGFALETEDRRFRATVKLEKKHCDLIVSNGPSAIDSNENDVELLGPDGAVLLKICDDKSSVARALVKEIDARLIRNADPADNLSRKPIEMTTTQTVDLTTTLGRLTLPNPIMVASGTFGYAREMEKIVDVSRLGGILPKTITAEPRIGNAPWRTVETSAGLLNAIGLDNDGIDAFLEHHLPYLTSIGAPIVVSVAGRTADEFVSLAARLGEHPIAGVELNLSCPNVSGGIDFGINPESCRDVVRATRDSCNVPVLAKLTPKRDPHC